MDAWMAVVAGVAYLLLVPVAASEPPDWDRAAFAHANRAGGRIAALRVPQQLGTPWTLPSIAVAAFWARRPHLAVSAALALPLEKMLEVGVKKLTRRPRPAQVVGDARLRDDAPVTGGSFPSGHSAIASCAAVLTTPYLPKPAAAAAVLAVPAGLTSFVRVHQGAHFPLDALGGILMGVSAGALLNYTFGFPASGR
jgi:membrane-associated phospholipid phosphatase